MKRAISFFVLLASSAFLFPGCKGGGGGGGGPFLAVGTSIDHGQLLGINEAVAIRFNDAVDPRSLQDNVFVFASQSGGATRAVGHFVVAGREVRFLPQLPTRSDFSDAGLRPDTHYTICVPAAGDACGPALPPPAAPLRSRSDRRLQRPFQAAFRTLPGPVPFRDPVPGPPDVAALTPQAGSVNVPAGSVQDPTVVTVFWTELLAFATVTNASIGIYRRGENFAVPVSVTLEQAVSEPVRVVLRPRAPLPCGADLEVRWTPAITDLVGAAAVIPASFPGFRTAGCTSPPAIVEDFDTTGFRDPSPPLPPPIAFQAAGWDVRDSGLLRAGFGFGGDGREGALVVPAGTTLDLETAFPGRNGVYQFESVSILGTLTTTGTAPVRLLSQGDVSVEGTIDLDGGDGAPGPAMNTTAPVAGGTGRAGGGNGGVANPNPGGLTIPLAARGSGPNASIGGGYGGNDSHIAVANPTPQRVGCGGGGGSFGGFGLNGNTDCANAGASGSLRGNIYGEATILTLQGGSGGGGGGNAAWIATPPVPFPNQMSHAGGGGGAGGGALLCECVGTFLLAGTGRVFLNGGNGALGGGPVEGKGGEGGAGSGGALKVQALTIALTDPGEVRALGGSTPQPTAGRGGQGRIRLEDSDGSIGGTNLVQPVPSVAVFAPAGNGRTVAQSLWYDTTVVNAAFAFDGSDPQTGLATQNTMDLRFGQLPGAGQTVKITFQGAPLDPANPYQPDPDATRWFPSQPGPSTGVPFATDITTLNGRSLRFVRFRIELNIGPAQQPPLPTPVSIDRLQIRVQ